jgi:hypothetical protein
MHWNVDVTAAGIKPSSRPEGFHYHTLGACGEHRGCAQTQGWPSRSSNTGMTMMVGWYLRDDHQGTSRPGLDFAEWLFSSELLFLINGIKK